VESSIPCGYNRLDDLTFASGACQRGTLQKVLLDWSLVAFGWFVIFESLGELFSVIEDFLDRSGHDFHLRNFARAGIA
jgi:hypothetical protein